MTEEEKKAIENIKEVVNICGLVGVFYRTDIETLLNLIEKLQKENEELKNKVIKRDNDIIYLEETAEKEFITKQEVKENYIQKAKIKEKLEELENEEKALRKDFEKHRVQLFELYKKVVLIEGYKKLLEEE